HKVLKSRSNKSRVEEICDENRIRYSGDQVPIQFVNHFQKFLGKQYNKECLDLDGNMFSKKINEQEAYNMIKAVTNKEIKEEIFYINDNKARPDGFTAKFFKKAWNVIGVDVCKAVNEFFLKGKLLGELNATLITLVPKLLKGYDCVKGPKRCSMKIDIQKAYDTVNWNFLEKALRMFGGRGLRQGDPLSPYLFIIVMEVFNLILQQEILRNGRFKYHHGCKDLGITDLCFADDILVLCHGDVNSVTVIKKALEKFSVVSWLYPNWKSIPGVPLVSKKIGVKDCKGLIDRVKARIQDWKNKSLSYAGRTQLIASVLSSIQIECLGVEKQNNDAGFESLLDLRDVARANIIYKIGNGKKASVWHDRWSDMPSLDTIIMSRREIYSVGFSDTVSKCINGNQWTWPNEWVLKYPILNQFPVPNINDDVEDKLVIWFSQNIPRQAFVLWMAIKKKLVTQDKLAIWYPGKIWKCLLCMLTEDSRNHLFFECEYSKEVWNNMQTMINTKDLKTLDSSMLNFSNMPCTNSIWSIVRRLTIASTVYHIWKERNSRVFQKKERRPEILYQVIRDNVKCRLLSLKVTNSKAVKAVEEALRGSTGPLGVTVLMNASFLVQFGLGRKLARYVWYYEKVRLVQIVGVCSLFSDAIPYVLVNPFIPHHYGCGLSDLGLKRVWKCSQEYRVLVLKVNWKSADECLDLEVCISFWPL
ncbi:RNA-directed DNA polymerase, eukaryota, reverse transcriptase zinc-binding domain protein, partial [Tanacetum coccineum]